MSSNVLARTLPLRFAHRAALALPARSFSASGPGAFRLPQHYSGCPCCSPPSGASQWSRTASGSTVTAGAGAGAGAPPPPSTAPARATYSTGSGDELHCKAAVAFGVNDLRVVDITVASPKAGEVRLKVVSNALCHTDIYTLEGSDPEGLFPSVLGHEAGAIVESVGDGVTSVRPGDHVIPCYTPQCNEPDCIFCASPKTNLCPRIRATQGAGLMSDGTSRLKEKGGDPLYHFMGCSTFAEYVATIAALLPAFTHPARSLTLSLSPSRYTVVAEISCAKVRDDAPLETVSLFGCGVTTGLGAATNTCKVDEGSSVAVFGLGAVGLAVIQASKANGASRIFAVDTNPAKFEAAKSLGATDCLNPLSYSEPIQNVLVGMTQWGVDYTFDATGNVDVMRSALEASHRGWGESCVIGVAAAGQEISTRPFQLVTGRKWVGTAFGGYKSRTEVPKLVDRYMEGDLPIDHYVTDRFDGIEKTVDAIEALHGGECLRAVVSY